MGHDHAPVPARANKKKLAIVLGFSSSYLVAEVIGGIVTKSLALLADAGHMLTDVGGLALALLAIRFAERPASPEKTYGYYRVEILAAVTNAVALVGISLYVLYEAVLRFLNPPAVESKGMLAIAAIGLVVNVAGVAILRSSSGANLNMKGAYFEVVSDALTSVAVIVAGVIMWTTGWYYADPILSAGIGLFIFPRTWKLLTEAVGVLLEGTPSDVNLTALREAMAAVAGVGGVHDLHVWSLTSGVNAMSAHVVLREGATYDQVLAAVHAKVTGSFHIGHVTIQVEPRACETAETHL